MGNRIKLKHIAVAAAGLAFATITIIIMVRSASSPSVPDATTDPNDPPGFTASFHPPYAGAELTLRQRKWYPDLLPATLNFSTDKALARAVAVARGMGWKILATDEKAGTFEATARSWLGADDDISVRVTRTPYGSRVDARSAARDGGDDRGRNALRLRAYLARVRLTSNGTSRR